MMMVNYIDYILIYTLLFFVSVFLFVYDLILFISYRKYKKVETKIRLYKKFWKVLIIAIICLLCSICLFIFAPKHPDTTKPQWVIKENK